jgi:hypothetical protein
MNMRRLDLGLYASCAVLVGAFTYEVWAPLGEFTLPTAALPERPSLPTISPFNPPPQSSFAAIDARPIFSPARKPIESTAVAGTSSAATPPDVALIGVILDGKTQLALLKREGAPFAESTAVGASVDGWEVTEITPDHVVLRSGAQEFVLSMDGKRKSQPSTPSARPSGAQSGPAMAAPFGRQPVKPRTPALPDDQNVGASDQQHSETVGAQ